MTKEQYDALPPAQKIVYEEFRAFSISVVNRLDALTTAMKKLLELATQDP